MAENEKEIIDVEPVDVESTQAEVDILPLKNLVLFPGIMITVVVSRPASKNLIQRLYGSKDPHLAVFTQKDDKVENPKADDLYQVGCLGQIVQVKETETKNLEVVLGGSMRLKLIGLTSTRGAYKGIVDSYNDVPPIKAGDMDIWADMIIHLRKEGLALAKQSKLPETVQKTIETISPLNLPNVLCCVFQLTLEQRQQMLESNLIERCNKLMDMMKDLAQQLAAQQELETKTQESINNDQRKYYLHHQLEAIQKELGDDNGQQIIDELKAKAEKKKWNEKTQKVFEEQLKRLQRLNPHSPDYASQLDYLETLLDLPWNEFTEDNYDIRNARDVLNREHFGLEKVKERILEYLAVLKQTAQKPNADFKAPILCLYGPPGVGKTSLGKSIAEALGRKYARISLGGLHDEAEIRGHRRTYIGALPGRIVENIRKVKSANPVFVLDEIDKIGADYKGDPTSALLEVLDPEQNTTFHDNYLDVDLDLSKVLFVATANTLDSIPRPLLDRMELIEMSGYLMEEKEEIAKRHLVPKEIEKHGLTKEQIVLDTPIIDQLIEDYTRESGVRNLSRQIATICRKIVTKIALDEPYNVQVTKEDVVQYLGQKRYSRDAWETNKYIGVVTGLAWTQVGGEILFIETSLSPSKQPTLTLTGNLGDVMKESATIALAYIKAHAEEFGIKQKDLDTKSVHIHVPEGAIPKDGPSAGITMTTALVSAFTGRKVRPRIAMTGEMTLRGKVLPIGGVKEKILAAKRAGITDLVLCQDNKKDVDEIKEVYLKGLTFHYVSDIQEVIDYSLL